jgi:hypothetical protein
VTDWHLAQMNIGRLRAPSDSPIVAEFMDALDRVNALAEQSPGFVWRFQTEDGNATAVRPYADELIIVNMSVWDSLDALAEYVYRSDHTEFLRRRREWFERMPEASVVLWWVAAGTHPTVDDGIARLERLRRDGPTVDAFTFRQPYEPGSGAIAPDERNACPA